MAAPSESLARRGGLLLEDALRTASIGDTAGARLLLIRRLDLGSIRADRSSATLALAVEQRFRALASTAVAAESAGAEAAMAVWFPDTCTAHAALLMRLIRDEPVDAWFWRAAVPAWTPAPLRLEAVRAVLAALVRLDGGVQAAAALVVTLAEPDADRLLAALLPADGESLLHACGWRVPVPEPSAAALAPAVAPAASRILARWARHWGAADARTGWLATALLVGERPARAVDPALDAAAAALVGAATASPAAALGSAPVKAPGASRAAPARGAAAPGAVPPLAARSGADVPGVVLEVTTSPVPGASTAAPSGPSPGTDAWRATAGAGLLFLVPVLERLGIAAALVEDSGRVERELPLRILEHAARHAGLPPDDAMLLALTQRPLSAGHSHDPTSHTVAPSAWRMDDPDRGEAEIWLGAAARWLRRHARIGVRALVGRAGRVAATATHIDVRLDLRTVDIRVRRAGLDVDPGWVPWLGRVVQFHYLSPDDA